MDRTTEYISSLLPPRFAKLIPDKTFVREIRMRLDKPFTYIDKDISRIPDINSICTKEDIELTVAKISDYSVNSVSNEIVHGFIRLKYGCRAGIAGEALMNGDSIVSIMNITSINFRIAREIKGCSDSIMREIVSDRTVLPTLIASPPGIGKTTLLRDIARNLARSFNTVIIDERGEIAGTYHGKTQFDVGILSDIIDSMPKCLAVSSAVRTLSPDVIITDEIGCESDMVALTDAYRSGVSFVATAHAKSFSELKERKALHGLFGEGIVKKAIILENSEGKSFVKEIITL